MRLRSVLDRVEAMTVLDRPAALLLKGLNTVLREPVRKVLQGVWLGHPLHPVLVQVPIGAWLGAALLDAAKADRRSSTMLVATGCVGAVPAAAAGLTDWTSLSREQHRVGLVHSAANSIGLGFYVGSLTARMMGNHRLGRRLSFIGLAFVGVGGYIGGHLSYRQDAGVNQAAPFLRQIPEEWHDLCELDALSPGRATVARIGEVPVLVALTGEDGGDVVAMIERCGHETGPLGEGEFTRIDGADCVVCPWHGSTFRLVDGVPVSGPAASTQPHLRTRVVEGRVQATVP